MGKHAVSGDSSSPLSHKIRLAHLTWTCSGYEDLVGLRASQEWGQGPTPWNMVGHLLSDPCLRDFRPASPLNGVHRGGSGNTQQYIRQ